MCGIYASISIAGFHIASEDLRRLLRNRGPDYLAQKETQVDVGLGKSYWISCLATVLSLRGDRVASQPFHDPSTGSLLCWNGEAWKLASEDVYGNDGEAIFKKLLDATSPSQTSQEATSAFMKVMQSISGPFAFVFLDPIHGQIYFGRDRLGRRSLLYKDDNDPTRMEISSIPDPASGPWKEVEADAIYQLDLNGDERSLDHPKMGQCSIYKPFMTTHKHMWTPTTLTGNKSPLGTFNREVPVSSMPLHLQTQSVQQLKSHVEESLKLRILNVPSPRVLDNQDLVRVAVLFSGGLDCTVLARIAHEILPPDQGIDLINVAFENPRVVGAARNASQATKQQREQPGPRPCASTVDNATCTVEESAFENCPDRQTGRRSFQELQTVCPTRRWRFVAVNVPYTATVQHRPIVISLIAPHNTEMDLSIALALYFSARGIGVASEGSSTTPVAYSTPARVLLSGLGADELFGGYTRHATAFHRLGFPGLLDELELDVDRLGKRNLGRDDRVISHWGREVRFPYLDEVLMKWAIECPIWQKTGFSLSKPNVEVPTIEPGKKILRLLAYDLGMHLVAMEKKRAIQFGARTAKMETGKTKGTSLIG